MKKKFVKYIIFSILFFSIISIVYQIAVVENPDFNLYDLATNLLSEFAGMIFTVLIFNEFLTYRQQIANAGKLKMLYDELDGLMKSFDFLFRAAAQKCIDDFNDDLWNKEVINTIRDKITLSEIDDCVFPAVPWYMFFTMQGKKILRKCENVRIQFQEILEPQISAYLFYLVNSSEMLPDLSNIKLIYENDLYLNYTRPENLGNYFACPTDSDFEVIKNMNDWLLLHKKESEKTIYFRKYNKIIIALLAAIFTIGAASYYLRGIYLFAVLFAFTALLLYTIIFKIRKTGRS